MVRGGIASVIPNTVRYKSQDIRDCIKIGTLAKPTKDVEFIADIVLQWDLRIASVKWKSA